jgi:hypothetical protein
LSPDQISFVERIVHSLFNMFGLNREEEGEYLACLAGEEYRLLPSYQPKIQAGTRMGSSA